LLYEIRFYLIFAVLLISGRVGLALIGLWTLSIVVANVIVQGKVPDMLHIWNIYFMFGMGACWLMGRINTRYGVALLGVGIVVLIASAWGVHERIGEAETNPLLLIVLALAFMLILLGAILTERAYKWTPPGWLLLLGDASYSIYLVHSAVLSLIAVVNFKLAFGVLPAPVVFIGAFVVSVCAGVVAHLVVERPLLALLRRVEKRPAAAVATSR
jgi:peptidoglycan/LPS O-acetylase OafA/YrhL